MLRARMVKILLQQYRHEAADECWAENVRSARVLQTSTCSAIAIAKRSIIPGCGDLVHLRIFELLEIEGDRRVIEIGRAQSFREPYCGRTLCGVLIAALSLALVASL
jgi:hypothetical protein